MTASHALGPDGVLGGSWHATSRFGLHVDLHVKKHESDIGADLHPEELRVMLQQLRPDFVQCDTKGHEGLTSWPTSLGNAAPGVVKDSLRIYRDVTRDLGIPLVAHHSGVWDMNAVEQHPSWAVRNADGSAHTIATCRLSGYDEQLLLPQLRELLGRYELDGVWIDGENWAATPCWCNRCRAEFTRRHRGEPTIPTQAGDPNWQLWLDFHRDLFREHVLGYCEPLRREFPHATVASNWMHTLRQPDPVDIAQLSYLSGDFVYAFGIEEAEPEAAFLDSRAASWDLMVWAFTTADTPPGQWTMKSSEQLLQEAAVIIARDGVVALYDQPTRQGRHLPWHTPILADVASFCRERQDIPRGSSSARVLVLLNEQQHYAGSDALFAYSATTQAVRGAVFVCHDLHVPVDVRTVSELRAAAGASLLDRYSIVIAAEQGDLTQLGPELQQWAHAGGHLVVTGRELSGLDSNLLGVTITASPRDTPDGRPDASAEAPSTAADGHVRYVSSAPQETVPVRGPWADVTLVGATRLAMSEAGDFDPTRPGRLDAGGVGAQRHRVGQGTVTSSTGAVFRTYQLTRYPALRRFIADLLDAGAGLPEVQTNAPPWIHLSARTSADGLGLLHVYNINSGTPLSTRSVAAEGIPPAPFSVVVPGDHTPDQVRAWPHGTTLRIRPTALGDTEVEVIGGVRSHVALSFPLSSIDSTTPSESGWFERNRR